MDKREHLFLAGVAIFSMAIFVAPTAFAASVPMAATVTIDSTIDQTATKTLDFGTIALSPSASVITINASSGAAVPQATSGGSIPSGGHSGEITVVAAMNLDIEVVYPADNVAGLTYSGTTLYVNNIEANSQAGGGATDLISHVGGTDTRINVGGTITFAGTENPGTYNGSMNITLNYN